MVNYNNCGSGKSSQWTEDEVKFLKQMYGTTKNETIAEALGKTTSSVGKKANKLGLTKKKEFRKKINQENVCSSGRCKVWTQKDIDYLKMNYGNKLSGKEIARELGRTYASVMYKVKQLGLSKDKGIKKNKNDNKTKNFNLTNWDNLIK